MRIIILIRMVWNKFKFWINFMKKSIEFNLVPDENKLYNAKMFKDNSLFKEEKVDAETMKYYMLQKMSEKELTNLRTAVKLFKTKKIKLHLKEQNWKIL